MVLSPESAARWCNLTCSCQLRACFGDVPRHQAMLMFACLACFLPLPSAVLHLLPWLSSPTL